MDQKPPVPGKTPRLARLRAFLKNSIFLIVAGVTCAVLILLFLRLPITEFIELKIYDLKFQYRGARPAAPEIALVAVDDDTVQQVGRWPW